MVPPPDSTGDEFPDFDSMTPEEQMAWLESLAKRQGVNAEELTTSADVEIAEVSPDTVIDEPGYVPYSISDKPKAAAAPAPPEPKPEPEPEWFAAESVEEALAGFDLDAMAEPLEPVEMEFDEEVETAEEMGADASDPMMWLDSLTAHPGEELEDLDLELFSEIAAEDSAEAAEFELDFDLEPEREGDFGFEPVDFELETPPMPETVAAEPALVDDDMGLPEGVDPMLWLESLAARQGASADQLTTSADLEVDEVPSDMEIDEPGYVPYDIVAGGPRARETEPADKPEPIRALAPEAAEGFAPPGMSELEMTDEDMALLEGADPMAWLETLAKRQGAKAEELTTTADLDIPEMPEDTVVDEPGYVAYSPFESSAPDEVEAPESKPIEAASPEGLEPSVTAGEEFIPELEEAADPLSWLEDLASEEDTDVSELLAFEEIAPEPARAAVASPDDPLAGMTDEEIAYAQAHGQLTGEQELAWLKRQAIKLAEARQSQEAAEVSFEDLEPAEPAELPAWLEQIREQSEEGLEVVAEPAALLEDAPLSSDTGEVVDWLKEAESEGALEPTELSFESGVDTLWAETGEEAAIVLDEEGVSDSELAAFLAGDLVPEEPDQLAEALDAEFERKLAGDDSEPEWYTEALARGAVEFPPLEAEAGEATEAETFVEEPALAKAAPVEMPDWLKDSEEEAELPVDSEMPGWLVERVEEEAPPVTEDMPDWLLGDVEESAAEEEIALDWLPDETPAPEPEVIEPVVEPQPAPAPPPVPVAAAEPEPAVPEARPSLPEEERWATYRQRLESDPNDHITRLEFARALRDSQALAACLDQFEVLVDVPQVLEEIVDDLDVLVEGNPHDPRARRLLGDAYMRQGKLQEALDAYRSALDQL